MKELIRQRALELGFDACRFTSASPPQSAEHFQQWLAENRHGEMVWMQKNGEKRVQPAQVLAGAKAIIVVAASYAPLQRDEAGRAGGEGVMDCRLPIADCRLSDSATEAEGQGLKGERHRSNLLAPRPTGLVPSLCGIIARYARFTDYHQIIGEHLRAFVTWIHEYATQGVQSLWYVDTGPILERDLAQRAGLGFVGKHTNLINRPLGNWFFIGEIITTLELEADPPEKNRCGACTRCLTACPTRAITDPFQLDARRCISYLTIELKGSIPLELRPAIGRRIFGCDDCLAVCPWNRWARMGQLMQSQARPDLAELDLVEVLKLDDAGFKKVFGGTPIQRLKRRGLLRNVCVALGNTGQVEALPALEQAVHDPDPLIAEHAQWAIDRIVSVRR